MKALTRSIMAVAALAALAITFTLASSVGTQASPAELHLNASDATITVDGDSSEWAAINGLTVPMKQFEIPPGSDWDTPGVVDPIDATLKVATDDTNIYVLFEVPDDYDFDGPVPPNNHKVSAALAVQFLIDPAAGPHMGSGHSDFEAGLGMVDLWHWELDCIASAMSGGGPAGSGNDPDCNMDDEYSTDPETREDDGGGDPNAAAENSLAGSWSHSGSAGGIDTAGTWTFEMSRPLQTGDPEDAAFAAGGTAKVALAYWDADEGATGWTDLGHVTSADGGWINVHLPGVAGGTDRLWADTDCSGAVNPIDSLKVLRHDAGLSVSQTAGCPGVGTSVTVAD